ncbi:response regulator [Desulfosporosinus sp. PR]|uniref:response regulator n=1 Tax=Candidatus Desulfosporosinus nitrosoreducens TaxID=3401928 RepID=UPI0027FEA6C3|nr:response regulator [Desulfosporosinus sp. PR]MDQ7094671.1 response regulator [Desulfosporosinus sp. PR]
MIKVIIVDDEPPSLDRLEKLINNSGQALVAGKFTESLSALRFLQENRINTVFLDIEMPDMNGIELATRILDLQDHIDVVFVTAYNQYAVEAFRLHALDYLMKPVAADRLRETLCRIIEKKGSAPSGELSVRCFGRFSVCVGSEEVRFRTEKAEELLAYLINNRGSFVSRSKILDSLWEDFEGDRAITHFNTTLHYVKKALLRYGVQLPVQYDRGSYRLGTDGLRCDYLAFCCAAEKHEIINAENLCRFEEAADVYAGEYLLGWEYSWAAAKRVILEEQYIRLLLDLASCYQKAGNYQRAVQWLEKGLLYEPLHRELNYRLVEVLLLAHNRAVAVKYYELYRQGLMKRLGTEPDEEFRKLLK